MFTFFISHGHLIAVSHKDVKCRPWQHIQYPMGVHNVGNWSFQVQLFKVLYHKNYAVHFGKICTVDVK